MIDHIRDALVVLAALVLSVWWTRKARMAYTGRHHVVVPAVYARNPYRPVRSARPALAAVVAHGWRHDVAS